MDNSPLFHYFYRPSVSFETTYMNQGSKMDEVRRELKEINRKLDTKKDGIEDRFSLLTIIVLMVTAIIARVSAEYVMVGLGVRATAQPITVIITTIIVITFLVIFKNFIL